MTHPKIDSDIPLPASRKEQGVTATLRLLKVGDSFLSTASRNALYSCAHVIGIKLSIRKTPEGLRVWRIG